MIAAELVGIAKSLMAGNLDYLPMPADKDVKRLFDMVKEYENLAKETDTLLTKMGEERIFIRGILQDLSSAIRNFEVAAERFVYVLPVSTI